MSYLKLNVLMHLWLTFYRRLCSKMNTISEISIQTKNNTYLILLIISPAAISAQTVLTLVWSQPEVHTFHTFFLHKKQLMRGKRCRHRFYIQLLDFFVNNILSINHDLILFSSMTQKKHFKSVPNSLTKPKLDCPSPCVLPCMLNKT